MSLEQQDEKYIKMLIEQVAERAAEKAAEKVIESHVNTCPYGKQITKTKTFIAGMALAFSILGGGLGAVSAKLIGLIK